MSSRRPRTLPVSIRVQGPWQIEATGLPASRKACAKSDGVLVHAQLVGVDDATGQQDRVEVLGAGFGEGHIDRELVAPFRELPGLHPGRPWATRAGSRRRPASSALRGSVISTCSKPSVTRIATFMPLRVSDSHVRVSVRQGSGSSMKGTLTRRRSPPALTQRPARREHASPSRGQCARHRPPTHATAAAGGMGRGRGTLAARSALVRSEGAAPG